MIRNMNEFGKRAREDDPPSVQLRRARERALVVDDEPAITRWLERLLRGIGWDVKVAHSLAEARLRFRENREWPTTVVLDMLLPDGQGSEIYPELKAARPDLRILVCSGYVEPADVAPLLRDGHRFLQKPFRRADLLQALLRLHRNRRQEVTGGETSAG